MLQSPTMAEVPQSSQSEKAEKVYSFEDFITIWPLYTPFSCMNGYLTPERISFVCEGPNCRKETTWARDEDTTYVSKGVSHAYVNYTCGLCKQRSMVVMFRTFETELRDVARRVPIPPSISSRPASPPPPLPKISVVTKVQKIGQFPPLSIAVPKALAKSLGATATSLYKKALINRNEGLRSSCCYLSSTRSGRQDRGTYRSCRQAS
jgi:hypothetical protein